MYMRKMISVGKAANGFVVECQAPIKKEAKKKSEQVCYDYPGSSEKQFVAKDAAEVTALITKLMPMLDEEYTSEEEFDAAFDSAAK